MTSKEDLAAYIFKCSEMIPGEGLLAVKIESLLKENERLRTELGKWHPTTPEELASYQQNLDR